MKKYICLNHGECGWADERPPREFTLDNPDELNCPNCESKNIKEAQKSPSSPWSKIAVIVGLFLLVGGITWYFWPTNRTKLPLPPPPMLLTIVGLDCKTSVLTLSTKGGDGSPKTFGIEGLIPPQKDSSIIIDKAQRHNKSIIVYAIQNKMRVTAHFTIICPIEGERGGDKYREPKKTKFPVGKKIKGSEFCLDGALHYSVYDNAGNIREIKVPNYPECQKL